jgi:hypothetical protein
MLKENQIDRRAFLSKSFKAVVGASMAIVATKVVAYELELGQDSTDVTLLLGGGTNVPHSSHSSRSWR